MFLTLTGNTKALRIPKLASGMATEIEDGLSFAETFGALAVDGVAYLANNDGIAEEVLTRFKQRTEK